MRAVDQFSGNHAIAQRVSYTTTMSAATAACDAILALRSRTASVRSLQEWHKDGNASREISGGTEPGGPADLKPAPDARGAARPSQHLASREAST